METEILKKEINISDKLIKEIILFLSNSNLDSSKKSEFLDFIIQAWREGNVDAIKKQNEYSLKPFEHYFRLY